MNQLNNIISEELLEYFLQETYQSVSEIKDLANDVVKKIAENNMEYIERDGKISYIYGIHLNNINFFKYKDLKNFIKDTKITISVNQKWEGHPKGSYSMIDDKNYDPSQYREIDVYIPNYKEFLEEINQDIEKKPDYNERDLYFDLFYKLYDTLLHELQHAYDDFRSKNKAYQTKEFDQYREKYKQSVEGSINMDAEGYIKYLNLPHEIWARFTQAMYKTSFTEWDREKSKDDFVFVMKPIKDVVKQFQYEYQHFRLLSDKMKRKLVNKVVQFWHHEKDKLDKENKLS